MKNLIKLRVLLCEPSKLKDALFFEAQCSEVTEHDLLGRKVYVKFSVKKEVGYTLDIDAKRIVQVETKKKRKVWVVA